MARITMADLREELIDVKKNYVNTIETAANQAITIKSKINTIKLKNSEIKSLQRHISKITAQRDRLVGYVEGSRSNRDSDILVETGNTQYLPVEPQKMTINRVDKFILESTEPYYNQEADKPPRMF